MEAATDPDERARRGRHARADVLASYTWDAATRRLSAVLADAAARREPQAPAAPVTRPRRNLPGAPAPRR